VEDAQGKLLVAGSPPGVGAESPASIFRLNQDGSLDLTFTAAQSDGSFWSYPPQNAILPQPDGTILVQGGFSLIRGVSRPSLASLNPNGTVDETFIPAVPQGGVMLLDGEKILVCPVWNGEIDRLKADGSLDKRFAVRFGGFGDKTKIDGMTLQGGRLRINAEWIYSVNGFPTPNASFASRFALFRLLLDEAPATAAVIVPDADGAPAAWNQGYEGMGQATMTGWVTCAARRRRLTGPGMARQRPAKTTQPFQAR
jgi:hypothetical protein